MSTTQTMLCDCCGVTQEKLDMQKSSTFTLVVACSPFAGNVRIEKDVCSTCVKELFRLLDIQYDATGT